jgi:hypothetical protein
MTEPEKATTKRGGKSPRSTKPGTAKAVPSRTTQQGPRLRRLSVSFQIRTAPEVKVRAEKIAEDHTIGGRSKLDAAIYTRGLWLTALLLGPGPDGSYAGLSERDLARKLEPFFDRQYAVLDRHQLLSSYVYRVLPPNGVPFLPTGTIQNGQQEPKDDEQYLLSEEAQSSLENFAEEI